MDWSNERVLQFLEIYRTEEVIWNPKHRAHKNKMKVNDAWNRISNTMKISINDLKAKKNSLMATFRTHFKKKKSSIRSGMGADEAYIPIWFAYEIMESFLAPVYSCEVTMDTENNASSQQNDELHDEEQHVDEPRNESVPHEFNENRSIEDTPHAVEILHDTAPRSNDSTAPVSQRQRRRQLASEINDAQKNIRKTFETLTNVIEKKQNEDECDLYGKLLAKKLRNYSNYERHLLMHEIDGILLRKPPRRNSNISNNSYSMSSPGQDSMDSLPQQSPVFIPINVTTNQPSPSLPNRPSSVTTVYAPLSSQSPVPRPSSASTSYAFLPSQSSYKKTSTTASYTPLTSKSPIPRPFSAVASYDPIQSNSPVQISIPESPVLPRIPSQSINPTILNQPIPNNDITERSNNIHIVSRNCVAIS